MPLLFWPTATKTRAATCPVAGIRWSSECRVHKGVRDGALTVSSSTGAVIIGDEALGCSPNTINGPVNITSNTGEVCLDGNIVNGPLTVTGNTGSVWVTDDTVTGTENVQT
jgi:hypothetical protein